MRGEGLVDPFSTAATFDGWAAPILRLPLPFADTEPWPTTRPRTWLLAAGWKRGGGLIHPVEAPA